MSFQVEEQVLGSQKTFTGDVDVNDKIFVLLPT